MSARSFVFVVASVLAVRSFAADLPVTDGLILDLDASDMSSMTLTAVGDVHEVSGWRSSAAETDTLFENARNVVPGTRYPNAVFHSGLPYLTEENGLPAVVFANAADGTVTNSLLATAEPVTGRTFFVVNRQHVVRPSGGTVIGRLYDYDSRVQRVSGSDNTWNTVSFAQNGWRYTSAWLNGEECDGETVSFTDAGGTASPHLLVVRSDTVDKIIETVGAGYVWQKDGKSTEIYVFDKCSIHEIVVYDRALSDAEVSAVSHVLMMKWGLEEAGCFWVGKGATNDLSDPGNWSAGRVPAAGETAYIFNASVSATNGCAGAFCRLVMEGVTLTAASFPGGAILENHSLNRSTVKIENGSYAFFNARLVGNIELEKTGDGELVLANGQANTAPTRILGGTVSGSVTNRPMLEAYGMTAHFDASDDATVTVDGNGDVVEWRSKTTGGLKLLPGYEAYPDAEFVSDTAWQSVDSAGRKFVRFGCSRDNVITGNIMAASHAITNGTVFFVIRPHFEKSKHTTIFGNAYNYSDRILRNYDGTCQWMTGESSNDLGMYDIFVNGEATNTFSEVGGITKPHLLTVRRREVAVNDGVFGAAWMQYNGPGGKINDYAVVYGKFDLYEAVAFDRMLSDEEIADVSGWLMAKWDCMVKYRVKVDAGDVVSSQSDVTVAEGAVLDVGRRGQVFGSYGGDGTLRSSGTIDLDGRSIAVGSLLGYPLVTNSSETVATLSVGSDADTGIEATVTGNIDVEKRGGGVTTMSAGLCHSGKTLLSGGVLKIDASDMYFGDMAGLVVHLDASRADSMSLDGEGRVIEWRSLDEKAKFTAASELFAGERFSHEAPFFFTGSDGLASVRFGAALDNTRTGTFMKAESTLDARTFFFVQKQRRITAPGTLIGNMYDYHGRIRRDMGSDFTAQYMWAAEPAPDEPLGDAWMNGRKAGDGNPYTFEKSGTDKPNLLVARRMSDVTVEIIGGAWVTKGVGGAVNKYSDIFSEMDLHELLVFDRALTDAEITGISAVLMKKWGVPTQLEHELEVRELLPADTVLTVTADATLDVGGAVLEVGGMELRPADADTVPLLTLVGSMIVTGAQLDFNGLSPSAYGPFVLTSGTFTGPFGTVNGLSPQRSVVYRGNGAKVGRLGFTVRIK